MVARGWDAHFRIMPQKIADGIFRYLTIPPREPPVEDIVNWQLISKSVSHNFP